MSARHLDQKKGGVTKVATPPSIATSLLAMEIKVLEQDRVSGSSAPNPVVTVRPVADPRGRISAHKGNRIGLGPGIGKPVPFHCRQPGGPLTSLQFGFAPHRLLRIFVAPQFLVVHPHFGSDLSRHQLLLLTRLLADVATLAERVGR